MLRRVAVCGGFRCLIAETATDGAKLPPQWRQSALGGDHRDLRLHVQMPAAALYAEPQWENVV